MIIRRALLGDHVGLPAQVQNGPDSPSGQFLDAVGARLAAAEDAGVHEREAGKIAAFSFEAACVQSP